jgi:RNA-directed DNA polymerase
MARQKSEDPVVPEGRRKPTSTRRLERPEGGKGVPVDEDPKQLSLIAETAEAPVQAGPGGGAARPRGRPATRAVPKSTIKGGRTTDATMDAVTERLGEAFSNVARNRGAPGPDGKSVDVMREHLDDWLPPLKASLLEGRYTPGEIRRVWIPKAGGSQRGLGIPNVIDRVVQEAVRLVLEPLYEPTFHRSSHGFRPGRSCHTAIAEAVGYVDEGYEWVVDLDLEKFFDRVNHQRLMSKLALRVGDKAVLVLIGRMLKANVVLPDGVLVSNDEGVPQGGPLSPLLSNIVLDELDRELERRGHRFVRYADDCNVYVRSERAGQRVMASLKQFIERRLRLKVNEQKSAVSRPEERHFVGFRVRREPLEGRVEVTLSKRSYERILERLRELAPRNWGRSLQACVNQLNRYLLGWIGFFGICTDLATGTFYTLDAHIRRRLRAIQLRHWKRKRTIARKLIQLGMNPRRAWSGIYTGHRSWWALSHTNVVEHALWTRWDRMGLVSIVKLWREMQQRVVAPAQLTLALG